MSQFPGIKFVDMGRVLGERWRALTPEEKTKYEAMSAEDKMRYQVELQQYTANQAAAQQQQQQQLQMQAMQQQQQQQQQQQGVPAPEMQAGQHQYIDPNQYHYPEYDHHSYN